MASAALEPQRSITLTEVEQTLRKLLLDVASYISPAKPSELRFTGGWVRDKLLGVDSHDIDVAINDMTGYQFGLKMREYLLEPGNLEKYRTGGAARAVGGEEVIDETQVVHELHKIAANPEKSKHLETVTTKIFGLDIDLVNLRKETYTEDSRNPQMEFGTPEEDALRRDATVNALFYNLQTQEIEDFTGHGLNDMQEKIIRTPLEPYQTFKDDPLRVLRLIRFASRLDYSIDAAAKQSMRATAIKESLRIKISRERVGVEVEKMLKGPDPREALSLINEMGLYHTIFTDPTTSDSFVPDTNEWSTSYDFAQSFLNGVGRESRDTLVTDKNDEYIAWLSSAFTPFADAPVPEQSKGKASQPLAVAVAREGIKATNKICDVISASIRNFDEIIAIKDRFTRRIQIAIKNGDPAARDTLGMAIRRWGSTWRHQAVFALFVDHERSTRDVLPEWDSFIAHLRSLDILNAYEFKTVIDGKTLAKHLETRPGPWMKEALDVVMSWQLLHPHDASHESAVQAVKLHQEGGNLNKSQGELVADLIHHFLMLTIRPLFAKTAQSHADAITAQARKIDRAQRGGPMPRKYDETEDETVTRPWKSDRNSYALNLLQWAVTSLTPKLAEDNWPLLVPPILTLLDDTDTKYKAKGCELLASLLHATPPSLLKRTGLADVFDEALKPSLSYLPTLTPEQESVHILNAAYPALIALTTKRHTLPPPSPPISNRPASTQPPSAISPQSLALITILHAHLLPSLTHISPSSTYPLLTTTLLTHLRTIISALAIDTIAQLIHLIPVLNATLAAPFATTTPETLRMMREAVAALQLVVANAWPRMLGWRGEVLEGAVRAWVALVEEDGEDKGGVVGNVEEEGKEGMRRRERRAVVDEEKLALIADVKAALKVFTEMVRRAVEAVAESSYRDEEDDEVVDFEGELKGLVDADARLAGLFRPLSEKGQDVA